MHALCNGEHALKHGKRALDDRVACTESSVFTPSISTGVYSFPVELAAKIAVKTVSLFLEDNEDSFDIVEWVLFDDKAERVYEAE